MRCNVVILATIETKREETDYLVQALKGLGIAPMVVDISLGSGGVVWSGEQKMAAMDAMVETTVPRLLQIAATSHAIVVGLGGGTGGDIIMRSMRRLPMTAPKMLITPLPFDPRPELADSAVVLVPTLVDICGLNPTLRQILDNAAAMISGLCTNSANLGKSPDNPSIALTALSIVAGAADRITDGLRARGHETTVFHANGFGGAAYARGVANGEFKAVIDLTCHELTRMLFIGSHTAMPTRFTAASDAGLAQVILPGGVNVLGLEKIEAVPGEMLKRPHYRHSTLFTHVKLNHDEMARLASVFAGHLNHAKKDVHLIVPMGGFSSQDAPGGAIEDPALRAVFLETVTAALHPHIRLTRLDTHINDPQTATAAIDALCQML